MTVALRLPLTIVTGGHTIVSVMKGSTPVSGKYPCSLPTVMSCSSYWNEMEWAVLFLLTSAPLRDSSNRWNSSFLSIPFRWFLSSAAAIAAEDGIFYNAHDNTSISFSKNEYHVLIGSASNCTGLLFSFSIVIQGLTRHISLFKHDTRHILCFKMLYKASYTEATFSCGTLHHKAQWQCIPFT